MDGITVLGILATTAFLVLILNLFCISIVLRNTQLRQKPSTVLIANLLSMHVIQAVATMPFYALKRLPETNSRFVCTGFRFFYLLTFYLACFCVLLISLDRLLAFTLKTRYRTTVTCKRVQIALAVVWLYTVGLCCIPFGYPTSKCSYNPPPKWVVFMLIVNCFLPCVAIAAIYTYIALKLRQFDVSRKRSASTTSTITTTEDADSTEHQSPAKTAANSAVVDQAKAKKAPMKRPKTPTLSKANRRITRNTMIIVASYGIAWLPSIFYFGIQTLFPEAFDPSYWDSAQEQYVSFFLKYIKFIEGVTSPILYCYLNTYFRKSVMEIFCLDTSAILPEQSEAPQARKKSSS